MSDEGSSRYNGYERFATAVDSRFVSKFGDLSQIRGLKGVFAANYIRKVVWVLSQIRQPIMRFVGGLLPAALPGRRT